MCLALLHVAAQLHPKPLLRTWKKHTNYHRARPGFSHHPNPCLRRRSDCVQCSVRPCLKQPPSSLFCRSSCLLHQQVPCLHRPPLPHPEEHPRRDPHYPRQGLAGCQAAAAHGPQAQGTHTHQRSQGLLCTKRPKVGVPWEPSTARHCAITTASSECQRPGLTSVDKLWNQGGQ